MQFSAVSPESRKRKVLKIANRKKEKLLWKIYSLYPRVRAVFTQRFPLSHGKGDHFLKSPPCPAEKSAAIASFRVCELHRGAELPEIILGTDRWWINTFHNNLHGIQNWGGILQTDGDRKTQWQCGLGGAPLGVRGYPGWCSLSRCKLDVTQQQTLRSQTCRKLTSVLNQRLKHGSLFRESYENTMSFEKINTAEEVKAKNYRYNDRELLGFINCFVWTY